MSGICKLCGAEFKSFVKPRCFKEIEEEKSFLERRLIKSDHFKDNDIDDIKWLMSFLKERIAKIVTTEVLHHELPDSIRKEKCILPYEKIRLCKELFKQAEKRYWQLKKIK